MYNVHVNYIHNFGLVVADNKVDELVATLIKSKVPEVTVSTWLVVDAFRVQHKQGNVNLTLTIYGKPVNVEPDGGILKWPEGFELPGFDYLTQLFI